MKNWQQELLDAHFPREVHDRRKWIDEYPGVRDRVVVHIPARGNSSRVPDKNIRTLGGKPLLAHTIESARMLGADRVIVNTDSPRIREVAEDHGAEVPFLRPAEISGDACSPGVASFYAICHLMTEGYPLDVFVDMYPTTPFRNAAVMRRHLDQVRRLGHCVTCVPFDLPPHSHYRPEGRVQVAEELSPGGLTFKMTSSFIGHKLNVREMIAFNYAMIDNPIEAIDIDEHSHFELAQYILEHNLYDFGGSS